MASLSTCPPLTRSSVQHAHTLITTHIHHTPIAHNTTISSLASTPQSPSALLGTEWEGRTPARPKIRVFFKCENQQRIGAFKARGAFHALGRCVEEMGLEELRARGVITHSSGNHAQALALAASTFSIPAHIIMPTISTPSKIAGTKSHNARVYFSGSTAPEREALVAEVQARTNAILIPPYDHPDIILGQGTLALEFEKQVEQFLVGEKEGTDGKEGQKGKQGTEKVGIRAEGLALDAVVAPCGGGGMLSGVATALHGTGIYVFGSEPSFQGGDDARRGLLSGQRVTSVKTLTIADGLRTPVGEIPWTVLSDKSKVRDMFAVTEEQIKDAMRLLLERAKLFVEPSAAVPLAVVLYNEDFRALVEREAGEKGWNVGVVLSGGNTTVDAIAKLFATEGEANGERQEGKIGMDGKKVAENVAG